jgi:UDP-N-acetylglucosamine--N-acetylmuramyl-(pentapeptide) pyrophosphoryl-undecaprenol N-acetylglucosamine transferase
VPLAIGNGEQRLNAQGAVAAGAAIVVDNAAFTRGLGRIVPRADHA